MDKRKDPVYILSASAVGPNADATAAERRVLKTDPESCDFQDIVRQLTMHDFRRIGHFSEISVTGSQIAIRRMAHPISPNTGIYFSTGLGEVKKTVSMFEQVLGHEEGLVSPYSFVNSVSSTTSFYVAKAARIESRNITVSQEELSFEIALRLAQTDIEDGTVDCALAGGADELSHPRSEHMRRIKLEDRQIMGEGSGWLCLGKNSRNAIGELLMVKEIPAPECLCRGNGDVLSEWLNVAADAISPWITEHEKTYLLPGFRLDKKHIEGLLNRLPQAEIKNYLKYCGCFHTAAAFGIASVFDQPHSEPALYFHVNSNLYGRTMVVGVRAFPAQS